MKSTLRPVLTIAATIFILIFSINLFAEEVNEERRKQFYKVNELLKLIQIAKESGYTSEEIKKLSLNDEDKVINVMSYIQEALRNQKLKSTQLNKVLKKKYLTVQDIVEELISLEPQDMQLLRDKLILTVDE